MTTLDRDGYERALQVNHNVREVTEPDDFGPVVLRELSGLVSADALSFNEVDPVAGRISYVVEPEDYVLAPAMVESLAAHADEHPLISYAARTGDGSARRVSDLVARDEWHESVLFREVYGPLGVEFQMSIGLPAPQPIVVGIALSRGDQDFSDADRSLLNLVCPHLAQSWRHAREHARVRTTWTLHFKDGAAGDDDSVANGQIVDPGGPASVTSTPRASLRHARARGRRVRAVLACTGPTSSACTVRLALSARHRRVALRAVSVAAGTSRLVVLTLNRRGRSFLAHHHPLRVRLHVIGSGGLSQIRRLRLHRHV